MISDGTHIWLSVEELTGAGISDSYIKKALYQNRLGSSSWLHKSDETDRRKVWIQYESLPPATQAKLPGREVLAGRLAAEAQQSAAERLRALHKSYVRTGDYDQLTAAGLTAAEANGLVQSAAWLRMLDGPRGKRAVEALGIPGVEDKDDLLALALTEIRAVKPEGLRVENLQTLRRKLAAWRKAGNDQLWTLVHKHRRVAGVREGNQGARKLSEAAERVIIGLWAGLESDAKMLPEQIWTRYIQMTGQELVDEETGEVVSLPVVSLSTVKGLLASPKVAPLGRYRHGEKWFRDTMRPYVLGKLPEWALSLTSSDGETCPFVLSGQKKQWLRPTAYLIFDAMSQAIVGCAVGLAENAELVRAAFYDMMLRLDGLMPRENQLDNFGRWVLNDELGRAMPVFSFCKPYNAQAKYAETLIGRFETQQLRNIPGWMGQNITAKRDDSRPNPDREMVRYTLAEVQIIYEDAVRRWNDAPAQREKGRSRWEVLMQRVNPACERMSLTTMARLWGGATSATIERGLIRIRVDGEEHVYEVADYVDLLPRMRNGQRVRVRYLPHRMDVAWIYNYDAGQPSALELDEYLGEVRAAQRTQRARAEQTAADGEVLGHHLKRGKRMDEYAEAQAARLPMRLRPVAAAGDEMTDAEAEAVLSRGYTTKDGMAAAADAAAGARISRFKVN